MNEPTERVPSALSFGRNSHLLRNLKTLTERCADLDYVVGKLSEASNPRITQRRTASLLEPSKGGGRPPKVDGGTTEKLLEEDVHSRPVATIRERRRFLEHTTGKSLSDSTVRRILKRLGFSQKTECGRWNATSGKEPPGG